MVAVENETDLRVKSMDIQHPIHQLPTREEQELQYNPRVSCPEFEAANANHIAANARSSARLKGRRDIAYGTHPLHRLDIFPAVGAQAPVHIFIHGGYWRAQDKANYAFVADMLVGQGITAVIINYELCPASTLGGVVASALEGIAWVRRNIADHGGNPHNITLSGHSAGAHLVAEALATDWSAHGIETPFITGALAVSGIFAPYPAAHISVNEQLRLTDELIAIHDMERKPVLVDCPIALAVGGLEPWHWIDQTFRYFHHLHRQGRRPDLLVANGFNHFDIQAQFIASGTAIGAACVALAHGKPVPWSGDLSRISA